jgi:thermitase
MSNLTGKLFIGAMIALAALSTYQIHARENPWAPGRILVQPKAGVSQTGFNAIIQQHGGKGIGQLRKLGVQIVEVPANTETAVVEALSRNPQIEFAEKDYLHPLEETTANDTYYDDAWHLTTINAPVAWDNSRGDGIVVAVLDTGVDAQHPDLQDQLLLPGWNSNDNDTDSSDVHGHGTKVTGVVAALSNNNIGVTSIAWNAKILPVRVSLPSGSAYSSTIANGLTWAADNGADVANISYAVSGSYSVRNAANYMRSKGGIVCVAAGNDGSELSTAPQAAILTISATSSNDALTGWSNYGDVIDLAAPGAGIWTTKKGGGYGAVSGTSFSSPATAAVAALVMAVDPSLSPAEVETILMENSEDLGTPGQDIYFGHGRIDAAAAVAAAIGAPNEDPPPNEDPSDTEDPQVSIIDPTGGTVSGQITVSITASDNSGVVSFVALYAGSTLVDTDSSAPYAIGWNTENEPDGPMQLTAHAYDPTGNQGTSQTVSVEVSNPTPSEDTESPQITILNPAESSTPVSGRIKIQAAATDNVAVVRLELYIDGVLEKVTTSDTLTHRWDSRKVDDGQHEIMAIATDAAENSGSSTRQITVSNNSGSSDGGGDTSTGTEKGRKKCNDGVDNDGDGAIDGDDPDCQ